MLIGSLKSPLNSSASSCARALLAITDRNVRYLIYKGGDHQQPTLESLLDIDRLLGTGLKVRDVAFRLAESHGAFRGDHPLALLHIDLVPQHDLQFAVSSASIGMPPLEWSLTKGKLSGSLGLAWIRNSSLQLSKASKLFELLTS